MTASKSADKTVKFLFEEDFDEPEVEIDPSAPEAPCGCTNEELQRLLAEAREEGRQEGLEEARVATEASIERMIEALAGDVARLMTDRKAFEDELAREAGQVAHTIALKLTPRLMKAHPLAEIERLTEECLREVGEEPRLVVRLHEAILPHMKARIDALAQKAGYEGAIVLLGDDTMSPLDCRIDWAHGGTERRVASLIKTVEAAVNRYLSTPAQPSAPAAQSEEE